MNNNKLLDWLTPEKLIVQDNVVILSLDDPAPQDGLVARCYPDGQLKFLGFYERGTCDRFWHIELAHGVEAGQARRYPKPGEMPDYESYRNGSSDRSDAWSDNSEPYPIYYEVWVRGWVKSIAGDVKGEPRQLSYLIKCLVCSEMYSQGDKCPQCGHRPFSPGETYAILRARKNFLEKSTAYNLASRVSAWSKAWTWVAFIVGFSLFMLWFI